MADPGPRLMRGLLEVFVLERLSSGPQHGYALIKEMEDRFGVAPNRNKMYPLLAKFEEDGLLRSFDDPASGRGKTMYDLTDEGREVLEDYRRVTRAFRDTVSRLWPAPAGAEAAAPPAPAPREDPPPRGATRERPAPAAPAPPVRVPVAAPVTLSRNPPTPLEREPYPCPEARVTVARDARSGDTTVGLTGCPMGAYEYCPRCPVFHAVEGLRKLTFG